MCSKNYCEIFEEEKAWTECACAIDEANRRHDRPKSNVFCVVLYTVLGTVFLVCCLQEWLRW